VIQKATQLNLGICGLVKCSYLDIPDLGFAILPIYENNGFIKEACRAVLEIAKHTLKLNKINAITTDDNIRSTELLLRIGFRKEDDIQPNGEVLSYYTKNL